MHGHCQSIMVSFSLSLLFTVLLEQDTNPQGKIPTLSVLHVTGQAPRPWLVALPRVNTSSEKQSRPAYLPTALKLILTLPPKSEETNAAGWRHSDTDRSSVGQTTDKTCPPTLNTIQSWPVPPLLTVHL
ncbi:hypothetical protein CDEST_11154 [Colletotrichum destructivum]|uniref:Uncharacterized protein n=1 Tax=Colletotrichum destructivum TaxID=34406 RepID=A0AAX4ISA9_9PEZI|nr:hypothetical protein CDEST_11154 [Colletotrichum destructivum]